MKFRQSNFCCADAPTHDNNQSGKLREITMIFDIICKFRNDDVEDEKEMPAESFYLSLHNKWQRAIVIFGINMNG